MKKTIRMVLLVMIPFLFTSCFDYVQSLSYQNGNFKFYCKMSMPKELCDFIGEDPEEIKKEFEREAPEEFDYKIIDNDYEIGVEMVFTTNQRRAAEKEFLPKIAINKYSVPFFLGTRDFIDAMDLIDDEISTEDHDFLNIALACIKGRLLISKKLIPSIKEAYFEGITKSISDFSLPVYDYGDSFCIEVPVNTLSELSETHTIDKIILISQ